MADDPILAEVRAIRLLLAELYASYHVAQGVMTVAQADAFILSHRQPEASPPAEQGER